MPKLPAFLAKLSSKQIYGIFAFATVLFVIISFVVAQNVQNYGKNSSSQANSQNSNSFSNPNSTANSANDSKKFSQNSNSNSAILNANSTSSESQNPYFINNSANSQPENSKSLNSSNKTGEINPNSQNQDSDQNLQKRYFKGKIGDLPIRMVLELDIKTQMEEFNKTKNPPRITYAKGNYIYENKSQKLIEITCGLYTAGYAIEDCSEKLDGKETGFWNQGTWSNPDKTVKLPFSLEKVEEFKLEDFLRKGDSKLQPLVADAEHDVVVLEECDLAVRFSKNNKLRNKIITKKAKNDGGTFDWLFGHKGKTTRIGIFDEENDGVRMDLSSISVECTDNFTKNYERFFKKSESTKEEIKFSSNCDKKDWFEEFNFSLKGFCGKVEQIILLKAGPGAAPVINKIVMFETKNITYSVRTFTELNFDLEFQPNSLAPSTASVKL